LSTIIASDHVAAGQACHHDRDDPTDLDRGDRQGKQNRAERFADLHCQDFSVMDRGEDRAAQHDHREHDHPRL
jgi:hypothetical protein